MKKILDVQNLSISFSIQGQKFNAVQNVNFSLHEGESIGIVGESGSGKSATVLSILRLIPSQIEQGQAIFQGQDLLQLSQKDLQSIRGKKIGVVFQDPMTSLNPTMKIGSQITEGIIHHRLASRFRAKQRAIELLHLVGIPDPSSFLSHYPHQLSGGMRQRVLISIALAANPHILIADEPTTALDPTIQAQILELLKNLRKQLNMSLILVSHDIGVVASLCDRVLVMYQGKIVEHGTASEVLNTPQHPYTQMLLHSLPASDTK